MENERSDKTSATGSQSAQSWRHDLITGTRARRAVLKDGVVYVYIGSSGGEQSAVLEMKTAVQQMTASVRTLLEQSCKADPMTPLGTESLYHYWPEKAEVQAVARNITYRLVCDFQNFGVWFDHKSGDLTQHPIEELEQVLEQEFDKANKLLIDIKDSVERDTAEFVASSQEGLNEVKKMLARVRGYEAPRRD